MISLVSLVAMKRNPEELSRRSGLLGKREGHV